MKSKLSAKQICLAGEIQYAFDFKKGLDDLIKADKTGKYICDAGIDWKKFDYKKGLDALIKVDKEGCYIYDAGLDWEQFNFNKALKILKNTEYYKLALKHWPKGIEQSLETSKDIRDKAKKLPRKKLRLKEENNMNDLRKEIGEINKKIKVLSKSQSPSDKYKLEMLKAKLDKLTKKYKNLKEEKTMWLVKYNNKEQWLESEEEVKIFTDKLKERDIKFKVSKENPPKPDEGKSEIDNPDRIVDDKLKTTDKLVGEEYDDEPRYIQIQNVKSKMWKKIDKKRGAIIGSSAKPYKNIPIVSSVPKGIKNIYKENKKEKFIRKLNEFKAEITATNPTATVANIAFATGTGRKTYRAEKTEKGWMIKGDVPPAAKAEVLDVLRYVGKNIKAFAKDDISTWDIVSGGTGIEVIDDSGKRYKLAFRKKR